MTITLTLVLAGPAAADFTRVGNAGGQVCDAEASSTRLAVRRCDGNQAWRVSADRGVTWTDVDQRELIRIGDFDHVGETLTAYGEDVDGPAFATLAPGQTVAQVVLVDWPTANARTTAGVADADGTHRMVIENAVATVAADGRVTAKTNLNLPANSFIVSVARAADDALTIRTTTGWLRVPRGGAPEPLPNGPVLVDLGNGTRAGPAGIFVNGAVVDNLALSTIFTAVPGASDLFVRRPGVLLRRFADDLYLPLASQPATDATVLADGASIFALDRTGEVFTSPRTEAPAAVPEAIAAINALRAEAGMPPLTAGTTTGALTTATSSGLTAADAGRMWVAAGLAWVTDPRVTVASITPTGSALTLATRPAGALLLRPRGFPNGTYSGPLSIANRNGVTAQTCRHNGSHQISAPFGTAISAAPPAGGFVTGLDLRRVGDPRPIRACRIGEVLVPDDALAPGTQYEGTVQWRIGATTPQPAFTWRFRTAGAPPAPTATGAKLHRLRIVAGRWTLRLSAAQATAQKATVRIRRGRKLTKRMITLQAENAIKLPGRRGWKVTVDVPAFTTPTGLSYKATHLTYERGRP